MLHLALERSVRARPAHFDGRTGTNRSSTTSRRTATARPSAPSRQRRTSPTFNQIPKQNGAACSRRNGPASSVSRRRCAFLLARSCIASSRPLRLSLFSGQIMDLESRNAQLTEELSSAPSKRPSASSPDWTPRAPARHTLSGHRMPITRVTFHPLFSQVVSASEDSTLKVWDWETGDFERTVKGHTKAVQDVDFDSKGNLLGEPVIGCAQTSSSGSHLTLSRSLMLLRSDDQAVGHEQRLEEHPDTARPRPLHLVGAVPLDRRYDCQCESRPNNPDVGGGERVRCAEVPNLWPTGKI